MRLNRGTIILLIVSVVVIVAVLIVNNNQMNTPEVEETVDTAGGPLLPDLTADAVVSLALSESESGTAAFTRLARDPEDETLWTVTTASETTDRVVDQTAAAQAITDLVDLTAESSFEAENLTDFGLDAPSYVIEVDTGETTLTSVLIGNTNPPGNRYYVTIRTLEIASQGEAASEGADEAAGNTVWLVNTSAIEKITALIADPPFEPLPTATPTPTATLNPMSEVEIATATAEAGATATAEMDSVLATIAAQPEATAEATAEVTEESG